MHLSNVHTADSRPIHHWVHPTYTHTHICRHTHTEKHIHARPKHTPPTHASHTHLSPLSTVWIPEPFITRLALTVTDGSARQCYYPSPRLIRPHQQSDSWSNVSIGGETAAINNPRHMVHTSPRRDTPGGGDHGEQG